MTYAKLQIAAYQPAAGGIADSLTFNPPRAELYGGAGLKLRIIFTYRLIELERHVPTMDVIRYFYDIVDKSGAELIAYHFHPPGSERMGEPPPKEPISFPHLHVPSDIKVGNKDFKKHHIPTGPISPIDVLRLLIEQWGVTYIADDWNARLENVRNRFFRDPFWRVETMSSY